MLIHITNKCNQRCVFCSYPQSKSKDEDLIKLIKEIAKTKDNLIQISGGEPALFNYEVLVKLLEYIHKKGKIIEFQTNASALLVLGKSKLDRIINLVKVSGGYFNINLSSHNLLLDFKITGIKNFNDKKRAIKYLNKRKANLRITYVINSLNYKHLHDFAKFIVKHKITKWLQFSFVKAIGNADENSYIVPRYEYVHSYLIKAMNYLEKNKIDFYIDHIPPCYLGKFWQKNVDIIKLKNDIKGPYLKEKEKPIVCRSCAIYSICSGVRKDYLRIYDFNPKVII